MTIEDNNPLMVNLSNISLDDLGSYSSWRLFCVSENAQKANSHVDRDK